MEEASKRRAKRNEVRKIILESVKFAGIVSVALIAPNVLGAMAKLGIIRSPRHTRIIDTATKRLVAGGLMEWKERKLRLTSRGEAELRRLTLGELGSKKPRRWDGKWRVLIFDIPERRKGLRRKIRTLLQAIGFVYLQHSVWVYPYDCEDLIMLLKADIKVGDDMLYMIVDSIERDKSIRAYFGLPQEY